MTARPGRPLWIAPMLAVLLMVLSILVGLATNSASSTPHWPGPLDLIRQHPWWTVLILGGLALVFVALATIAGYSGPAPVSNKDLVAVEERLYQHLDTEEARRSDFETRAARLPPAPVRFLQQPATIATAFGKQSRRSRKTPSTPWNCPGSGHHRCQPASRSCRS